MEYGISRKAPSNYSEKTSFFIIFSILLILLFFDADELFGAVDLRAFYSIGSVVVSVILILGLLALIAHWRIIPNTIAIAFGVLILLGCLTLNAGIVLVGWVAYAIVRDTGLFPCSILFAIAFTIAIAAWLWGKFTGYTFNPGFVQFMLMAILLIAPIYLLGIGFSPQNSEFDSADSVNLNNHHYYLYRYWGWLGDPDTLELYECNQFALACKSVYRAPAAYYQDKNVVLIPDVTTNSLAIQVDNTTIYTYELKAE